VSFRPHAGNVPRLRYAFGRILAQARRCARRWTSRFCWQPGEPAAGGLAAAGIASSWQR